jgi:predicted secreted Zn-dependent protease
MGLLWLLSWKLETETHLGSCQMKNATITVQFTADFPLLEGPVATDAAALEAWNAEMEQLFTQRVETLKVLRDGAREIYREVSRLRGGSCGEMTSRANDMARIKALDTNGVAAQTLGVGTD